ncbi:MAG: MmgE/PrpD family protein, partial [Cycloclasticus pugetii]
RVLKHREHKNRGCFDRPLSADDIAKKFFLNCQLAISKNKATEIQQAILNLASFSSVTELTSHL